MREMKDSGIEWIGEIPETWELSRLKRLGTVVTGSTPSKSRKDYYENGKINWIKPENITDDFKITPSSEKLSEKGLKQARLIPMGSAIISCIGTIGKVGIAPFDCATNQQINSVIFNKKEKWDGNYGKYALISSKEEHEKYASKVVLSILNKSKQENIVFPVPPLEEQQRIANFLDDKTSKIDSLITTKEKQMELLNEYKQSLISETVTKGLNPNVKMKDSGVEWIGEIPEHWSVVSHKRYLDFGMGKTILAENLDEVGYPVFSATETGRIFGFLKELDLILEKGDLVIPARGNSIGSVLYVENKGTCTQTTIYGKIKGTINSKFVFYFMKGYRNHLFQYDKTAIPQITVSQVSNNPLLFPPINEQQQIVNFLNHKTSQIDSLIQNIQNEIDKLKEYKQSLIFEVVTGKFTVKE